MPTDPTSADSPVSSGVASAGRALSRDELIAFGERLGRDTVPPRVLAISGDLGAGKTTLVQAICRGFGVAQEVTSPTFALVHEYRSPRGPVFHLDLYRLTGEHELTNLGWDEIIASEGLVLVEWPERAGRRLPREAVRIELAHDPRDAERRIVRSAIPC